MTQVHTLSSCCENDRSPRESGVALVFAVVGMLAVIGIGLLSLVSVETHARVRALKVDRLRASGVTDGAISEAYQRLAADPTWRGTFNLSDGVGGTSQINVAEITPDQLEITVVGNYGNASVGLVSTALADTPGSSSPPALAETIALAGSIVFKGGTALWSGEVVHSGTLTTELGGSYVGSHRQESVEWVGLNIWDYQSMQTDLRYGTETWNEGDAVSSDLFFVSGTAEALGAVTFEGTLVVDGTLLVKAPGADVVFRHGSARNEVLMIDGNILLEEANSVTFDGNVICNGTVIAKAPVNQVNWTGGLSVAGSITVECPSWVSNYTVYPIDPVVLSNTSGLRTTSSTPPSDFYETSRRPIEPTAAAPDDGPDVPVDDPDSPGDDLSSPDDNLDATPDDTQSGPPGQTKNKNK